MDNYKTKALSVGSVLVGNKAKHKYEIIQYLGRGGFGITYLAKETRTVDGIPQTLKYTIKEFCLSDICARETDGAVTVSDDHLEEFNESKAEFQKEAEHLKELSHEGIVPVSEVFGQNNTIYYVMQFLGDTTLLGLIKQQGGSLDEDVALDIIRKVAASLGYLHDHMMTHLDVKPDNIMMLKEGDSWHPVLIDFGLSCHYGRNGKITAKVAAVGTSKGYSPMEQYVPGGVKSFTPQADIYALGATLFHMLTGQVPAISTEITAQYIYKHLPDGLTERTAHAIVMAMQKNVEDRPKNIQELLQLLNGKHLEDKSHGSGSVTERGSKKIIKKNPNRNFYYAIAAVAVAVIIVLVLAILFLTKRMDSTPSLPEDKEQIEQTDSVVNNGQTTEDETNNSDPSQGQQQNGQNTNQQTNNNTNHNNNNTNNHNNGSNANSSNNSNTNSGLNTGTREKDLGYAIWYGSVVKGKPEGEGKMVFKSRHLIDTYDPESREAEAGDYVKGEYQNGHLVNGNWYDASGNKKQYILIGGF